MTTKLIPWAKTVNWRRHENLIEVRVDIEGIELNYEHLSRLAETFGTTDISFTAEHESGSGGCDTCGYGGTPSVHENVITVRNPTKNTESL